MRLQLMADQPWTKGLTPTSSQDRSDEGSQIPVLQDRGGGTLGCHHADPVMPKDGQADMRGAKQVVRADPATKRQRSGATPSS
jgi:hypothetical protein